MSYWVGYFLILLMIGGGLLLSLAYLHSSKLTNSILTNLILITLSIFITFMGLEFYFKLFFAQSDGFRYTLASQNWYDRYWSENSLGYRDVEWTPEKLEGKIKVIVVGDSFVAGSGIADPSNRFSNQLGGLLGANYAVLNVSSPGWDTIDEINAIVEYPYKPDMIVLSYYINDIEGVAYRNGLQRPQIRKNPPAWFLPLVEQSYTINFFYWRLIRLGPQKWADVYWNGWLKKINSDPEIKWQHRQELLTIVEGAKAEKIPLFVLVFPNLVAVEESQVMTNWVIALFHENDIPVLDVSNLLAGRNPSSTVVNAVDAHPNELVNLEIAKQLYKMIQSCQSDVCMNILQ